MCKLLKMKKSILLIIVIFINFLFCYSQMLIDEENQVNIYFPQGTYIAEQDASSYLVYNQIIPVESIVKIFENQRFSSSKIALEFCISKLQGNGEYNDFKWRNTECCISSFSFNFGDTPCTGWAVSVLLPSTKKYLCVLAYTAEESDLIYQQYILSILDSIIIDRGSEFESGIITSFSFPKQGDEEKIINFNEKQYSIIFDKSDIEANQYLIHREYEILNLYLNSEYWLESWKRYYQMIYKDSYSRIKRAAFMFCNAIIEPEKDEETQNLTLAETLLLYTQSLPYGTISEFTDFTDICSCFLGEKSDCDSRSMLLAIILNQQNIKSTLFISKEYEHAIVGSCLKKAGAKIQIQDNSYLLGDSTTKVPFGLIAQSLNDTNKWINVQFPE